MSPFLIVLASCVSRPAFSWSPSVTTRRRDSSSASARGLTMMLMRCQPSSWVELSAQVQAL